MRQRSNKCFFGGIHKMKCGGWEDSRPVHFALCVSMATVISDVAHRNSIHIQPKILIQAKVLRRWASFSYVQCHVFHTIVIKFQATKTSDNFFANDHQQRKLHYSYVHSWKYLCLWLCLLISVGGVSFSSAQTPWMQQSLFAHLIGLSTPPLWWFMTPKRYYNYFISLSKTCYHLC